MNRHLNLFNGEIFKESDLFTLTKGFRVEIPDFNHLGF